MIKGNQVAAFLDASQKAILPLNNREAATTPAKLPFEPGANSAKLEKSSQTRSDVRDLTSLRRADFPIPGGPMIRARIPRPSRPIILYLLSPAPEGIYEALVRMERLVNRPEITNRPFLRIASEYLDTTHPFHRRVKT
jgi:hypothetical protein